MEDKNKGQGRGQGQGRAGGAPGQQKTHTITNAETGEERQITQQEWRTEGKALREQGFARPEDAEEGEFEDVEDEDTEGEVA